MTIPNCEELAGLRVHAEAEGHDAPDGQRGARALWSASKTYYETCLADNHRGLREGCELLHDLIPVLQGISKAAKIYMDGKEPYSFFDILSQHFNSQEAARIAFLVDKFKERVTP